MKFAYIEISDTEEGRESTPGREIAVLICQSLNGDGPYERGDYGWEWTFRGNNYKALAVIQQYESGWLIPVNIGFFDRVFKRGASVLEDLCRGIEKALGNRIERHLKFESEQEFRDSGV